MTIPGRSKVPRVRAEVNDLGARRKLQFESGKTHRAVDLYVAQLQDVITETIDKCSVGVEEASLGVDAQIPLDSHVLRRTIEDAGWSGRGPNLDGPTARNGLAGRFEVVVSARGAASRVPHPTMIRFASTRHATGRAAPGQLPLWRGYLQAGALS